MKVILDIPDSKAASVMDDLKRISNLKIKTIISSKALFLKELKSSIDEVKSAKEGKTILKSADQLLNEL